MTTLALITLPLPGHYRPMMAAARSLRRAGHRPVIVGPADVTAKIAKDIETLPIGLRDLPPGQLDALCACLTRMRSWGDAQQMFKTLASLSAFYLTHLPAAMEQLGADAILHDQLEPGAGIVARGLSPTHGTTHISLACALPMNRDGAIPPPFLGWKYRPSAFGHWLNGGYYNVVNWLLAEQSRVLEAGAARFGLTKPDGLKDWQRPWSVDDGISRTTDLAQGLASLDFPRDRPPTYLGPLRDDAASFPGLDSIAGERDGRQLAFISLGTLMGGRARILSAMAKAASARGLQPVVVHGGRLRGAEAVLPRGTIARDFLDQADILSDARAAIIHGGYNSTTDAVSAGVPLITVPLAFEQGAIGARVERAELGRTVSAVGPSLSQRIQLALGDVLSSPAVAQAVRRSRFEAMAAPGLPGLVAAIDTALTTVSNEPLSDAERAHRRARSTAPVKPYRGEQPAK
jgi:zeaxanthin glucosyltransferase